MWLLEPKHLGNCLSWGLPIWAFRRAGAQCVGIMSESITNAGHRHWEVLSSFEASLFAYLRRREQCVHVASDRKSSLNKNKRDYKHKELAGIELTSALPQTIWSLFQSPHYKIIYICIHTHLNHRKVLILSSMNTQWELRLFKTFSKDF